ncbi:MAG: GAF domain-containing protein [Aeromicrobium sp.]
MTTHELALPGAIARAVSARTHRGCDVDLTASTAMTAATALEHANDRALERYDLVVVILGVNDALQHTPPALWRASLADVISAFVEGCPVGTPIVVVGIQPIRSIPAFDGLRGASAERHAQLLNRETERLCGNEQQATFVPLPAPTPSPSDKDRHRTARTYHAWGQVLAQAIVPLLTVDTRLDGDAGYVYPMVGTAGSMGAAEIARQRAVDELAPPGLATTSRLQHILLLAQQAFGAQSAMITIIDRDRQWQLAGTEAAVELPRSISVCDLTIRGDGAMIVRDSRLDARFRDNPLVTGTPHLRFYAGFPIESPAGQRLGALCVLDGAPRRPSDDLDVDLLRELAHMVQHELWPSGSDSLRIG